jgi:hypothetical protein
LCDLPPEYRVCPPKSANKRPEIGRLQAWFGTFRA